MNVIQFKIESNKEQSLCACLKIGLREALASMTDEQLTRLVKAPLGFPVELWSPEDMTEYLNS